MNSFYIIFKEIINEFSDKDHSLVVECLEETKHNSCYFHINSETKLPQIVIFPNSKPLKGNNSRLISTLAHEFGHYISYLNQTAPSSEILTKYNDNKFLSIKEVYIILAEEFRAWKFAYQILNAMRYKINLHYAFHCWLAHFKNAIYLC